MPARGLFGFLQAFRKRPSSSKTKHRRWRPVCAIALMMAASEATSMPPKASPPVTAFSRRVTACLGASLPDAERPKTAQ